MELTVARKITGPSGEAVRSITIQQAIPHTLAAMVEAFGEPVIMAFLTEAVRDAAVAEIARVMQGGIRGVRRMSDEQIVAHMSNWKFGIDYAALEANFLNIAKLSDTSVQNAALSALGATREQFDLFLSLKPAQEAKAPAKPKAAKKPAEEAPKPKR